MPLFSDTALKQIVAQTLPQLPPGHHNAVVGTVDANGIKVVAGLKLKDGHVEVTGAFEHDWSGNDQAGANVLLSW